MERLTKRVDGIAVLESWAIDKDPVSIIQRLCNRLAAYEDTCLDPQDIISAVDMAKIACALHELNAYKDIGPIDHLRDLLQAEQDGRLVVLPCKVGDAVYWLHNDVITECRVHRVQMNRTGLFICLKSKVSHGAFRVDICLGKTVFLTREEAEAALSKTNTIPCKHGLSRHRNEIGEDEVYCELNAKWMNMSLGDCLGNCESEAALAGEGGEG